MSSTKIESWEKFKISMEPKTLASRIAYGRFRWVNRHITSRNFPIDFVGEGQKEVYLAVYDQEVDDCEILGGLGPLGFRPASFPEYLALAELLPDVWNFPVIGLSNPFRHRQQSATHYPIIRKIRMSRCLDLISSAYPWPIQTRYPVVRIVASP